MGGKKDKNDKYRMKTRNEFKKKRGKKVNVWLKHLIKTKMSRKKSTIKRL